MSLTPEAILALAPDSSSAANGKKLATPAKWPALHTAPGLLWGEAQGSGKNPYLVGVDLNGYVSKCSCPSRKFPCKHALALMLLHAQQPDKFIEKDAPETLQKWLEGRGARAEAKEQKAEETAKKEADPAAQAKRRAAREKKVTDGLAALDVFLKDVVRDGLAQASSRPYSDWDTQAARLVDAQATGAARLVRRIPSLLRDPAALLTHLGKLHLLCEAWTRRESLSETEQADLRSAIGFTVPQAEVQAQDAEAGEWLVVAQFREEEDTLTTRRTWLRSGLQSALLLDFAPAGRPLPPAYPQGMVLRGELVYFPSTTPQRALFKTEPTVTATAAPVLEPLTNLDDVLAGHAALLAQNIWLERSGPYLLGGVRLAQVGEGWRLVDGGGLSLAVRADDSAPLLRLLAESGGHPMTVAAEWDGSELGITGRWGNA